MHSSGFSGQESQTESVASRYTVEKTLHNLWAGHIGPRKFEQFCRYRLIWFDETLTAYHRLVLMAEHLLYRFGQLVRIEQEKTDLPHLRVRQAPVKIRNSRDRIPFFTFQ